jgi:hypothetical protein
MALNHLSQLWLDAEDDLVEKVARRLAARHGSEIFGFEAVTPEFLNRRWRAYETDARDCIVEVRSYDQGKPSEIEENIKANEGAAKL